jgi:hypothetical protein
VPRSYEDFVLFALRITSPFYYFILAFSEPCLKRKCFFNSPFGEVKKIAAESPTRQLAGNAQKKIIYF